MRRREARWKQNRRRQSPRWLERWARAMVRPSARYGWARAQNGQQAVVAGSQSGTVHFWRTTVGPAAIEENFAAQLAGPEPSAGELIHVELIARVPRRGPVVLDQAIKPAAPPRPGGWRLGDWDTDPVVIAPASAGSPALSMTYDAQSERVFAMRKDRVDVVDARSARDSRARSAKSRPRSSSTTLTAWPWRRGTWE